MAPIFFCKCTNCSCTATVLLNKEMEEESNKLKQMQLENNKTVNCEEAGRRKDYFVEDQKEESETSEIIEKLVLLVCGALLLLGKGRWQKFKK